MGMPPTVPRQPRNSRLRMVSSELSNRDKAVAGHGPGRQCRRAAVGKELRFTAADGEWRVAFGFDPRRRAILLVAGDKSGVSERRFYRELVRKADDRFDAHLARLRRGKGS
jgi:Phage derived protein Gp49-like (DUF891)